MTSCYSGRCQGNVTSRHEPATLIRDVTPYRSPGCADVLRGARAHVTDFSYMTLMDKSAVKHNILKEEEEEKKMEEKKDEIEKKKMNKQKKS